MARSFNRLCQELRVTPAEREKLAWHLATVRARETYHRLREEPK